MHWDFELLKYIHGQQRHADVGKSSYWRSRVRSQMLLGILSLETLFALWDFYFVRLWARERFFLYEFWWMMISSRLNKQAICIGLLNKPTATSTSTSKLSLQRRKVAFLGLYALICPRINQSFTKIAPNFSDQLKLQSFNQICTRS